MIKKSIYLDAQVQNLEEINILLEDVYMEIGVPMKIQFQVSVAVEELFVNICHYAYKDSGEVTMICQAEDGQIRITFIDSGIPFNPLTREDPNTKAPVEERKIGGLGIFMVKKNMDEFLYEYYENKNIVTIIKNY